MVKHMKVCSTPLVTENIQNTGIDYCTPTQEATTKDRWKGQRAQTTHTTVGKSSGTATLETR